MPIELKPGTTDAAPRAADEAERRTAEQILLEVEPPGDEEVREYSQKFDRWSPADFRLSPVAIAELVEQADPGIRADIEFAQRQIRAFAEVQRDAIRDVEVETLPGVTLGHKNIPIES